MMMLFIGNQLRLSRLPLVAAVEQRRAPLIHSLARQQIDAGANWLLVDMGPQRKGAARDMTWLVQTIQEEVAVPLVLRSDDPGVLEQGIQTSRTRVLIDATLPGVGDLDPYLALAQRSGSGLAFSACPNGLPLPLENRLALVTETLLPRALAHGLPLDDLLVDPMLAALTCDQAMVPVAVEALRLLKVAADPVPNTLVHLDDIADGVADGARSLISQAYVTMLLAAGVDALVLNVLDAELLEAIRVVRERDAINAYDRLLLRLFDSSKAEVSLEMTTIDRSDPQQVGLFKTVQVLTNQVIYADSYLSA
jgi:5-methyltetrahydrofolate corrinoid/iron sulfur protein methyltransferase